MSTSEHKEKSQYGTRDRRIYSAGTKEGHVFSAFLFRLVPEAFKCEPMHRKGKPYHLFSHIFRPEFVKYNFKLALQDKMIELD